MKKTVKEKFLVVNNPRLGFYEEEIIEAKSMRIARQKFKAMVKRKYKVELYPEEFRARKWKGSMLKL